MNQYFVITCRSCAFCNGEKCFLSFLKTQVFYIQQTQTFYLSENFRPILGVLEL